MALSQSLTANETPDAATHMTAANIPRVLMGQFLFLFLASLAVSTSFPIYGIVIRTALPGVQQPPLTVTKLMELTAANTESADRAASGPEPPVRVLVQTLTYLVPGNGNIERTYFILNRMC